MEGVPFGLHGACSTQWRAWEQRKRDAQRIFVTQTLALSKAPVGLVPTGKVPSTIQGACGRRRDGTSALRGDSRGKIVVSAVTPAPRRRLLSRLKTALVLLVVAIGLLAVLGLVLAVRHPGSNPRSRIRGHRITLAGLKEWRAWSSTEQAIA
jgi:hypothetical protein